MTRGDSMRQSTTYHNSDPHLFEKPFFQYVLVFSIIATLIISVVSLVNVYRLKSTIAPTTININDFLKKLTSNEEMKGYVGVAPLNVIQINNNNLGNLQTQISGLDTTYLGNFIVQYTDKIVVYDYNNNKIKATMSLQQALEAQLPTDLFTKLNKHNELKGLEKEKPIGGALDETSLNTLKQQFPDVYKDAKIGDYLLRYKTKLIIYDYKDDKIVNTVDLG